MALEEFLELHENGVACVSIQQMPYDCDKHRYTKTYFEEDSQEDILNSDIFREIADKEVDHFNIIGGGGYPIELCIYLKKEDK